MHYRGLNCTLRNGWFCYVIHLLLLLLLRRFSRVRLCATPQTAAHEASPSLEFSRQEHWSGLPFPSPMHESEKSKCSHSVVSDSSGPHGLQAYQAPRSMGFSRQEWVAIASSGIIPWSSPKKGTACMLAEGLLTGTSTSLHYTYCTHHLLTGMKSWWTGTVSLGTCS